MDADGSLWFFRVLVQDRRGRIPGRAGLAKRIVNGDTPVLGEHGRMPM
jgi:hypothetical protein